MPIVAPDYCSWPSAGDPADLTGFVYGVLADALSNNPPRVDQASSLLDACVVDVNALASFLSMDGAFLKQFRFISALAFVDEPRTLGEAIIHLGIDRTRNVALACFLLDRIASTDGATPKMQTAFIFADACWSVAGLIDVEEPEQAYIAGLLSSLGHLQLSPKNSPENHQQLRMMFRLAELAVHGLPAKLVRHPDLGSSMEDAHTCAAERSVADFSPRSPIRSFGAARKVRK